MERWRAGNVNLKRQSRERGDDLLLFIWFCYNAEHLLHKEERT